MFVSNHAPTLSVRSVRYALYACRLASTGKALKRQRSPAKSSEDQQLEQACPFLPAACRICRTSQIKSKQIGTVSAVVHFRPSLSLQQAQMVIIRQMTGYGICQPNGRQSLASCYALLCPCQLLELTCHLQAQARKAEAARARQRNEASRTAALQPPATQHSHVALTEPEEPVLRTSKRGRRTSAPVVSDVTRHMMDSLLQLPPQSVYQGCGQRPHFDLADLQWLRTA